MKQSTQDKVCGAITAFIACTGIAIVAALASYEAGLRNGQEQMIRRLRNEVLNDFIQNQRIEVRGRKVMIEYDGETYEHYINY